MRLPSPQGHMRPQMRPPPPLALPPASLEPPVRPALLRVCTLRKRPSDVLRHGTAAMQVVQMQVHNVKLQVYTCHISNVSAQTSLSQMSHMLKVRCQLLKLSCSLCRVHLTQTHATEGSAAIVGSARA